MRDGSIEYVGARAEAVRLRKEEKRSLNEIQKTIGVAKSTLSLWLRPYPLSELELQARKQEKNTRQRKPKEQKHRRTAQWRYMGIDPKRLGERSEAAVMLALFKMGLLVLTTLLGDSERYDFVIDYRGRFYKVQVKTARRDGEVIRFRTCSSSVHRGGPKRSYHGEVDFIAAYEPDLDRVFIVPTDKTPSEEMSLRLSPPTKQKTTAYHLASDYELTRNWTPRADHIIPG